MKRRYTTAEIETQTTYIKAHYKQDMTAREIAEHLGIPRRTVIKRARDLGLCSPTKIEPSSLNPQRETTYGNVTLPRLRFLDD